MSGRWANSNRRAELPADWPARRAQRLHLDAYRCTHQDNPELPDTRCPAPADDVHHAGGRHNHDIDALRSLCRPHHATETAAEAAAARWRHRQARMTEPHPGLR